MFYAYRQMRTFFTRVLFISRVQLQSHVIFYAYFVFFCCFAIKIRKNPHIFFRTNISQAGVPIITYM